MDQISKRGFNTFHGPFAPLSRTKHGTCILWKQPAVFDLKSYILNKSLWPWVNKDELASNRCFQNSTAAVLSPARLDPVERIMPGMVDPTNMSKMPMFIWKQGPTCFFYLPKNVFVAHLSNKQIKHLKDIVRHSLLAVHVQFCVSSHCAAHGGNMKI